MDGIPQPILNEVEKEHGDKMPQWLRPLFAETDGIRMSEILDLFWERLKKLPIQDKAMSALIDGLPLLLAKEAIRAWYNDPEKEDERVWMKQAMPLYENADDLLALMALEHQMSDKAISQALKLIENGTAERMLQTALRQSRPLAVMPPRPVGPLGKN